MKKILFVIVLSLFLSNQNSFGAVKVKEFFLSNNIKVLFEKTNNSQAASIKIFTPVSYSSEKQGQAGISHLTYYSMTISTLDRLREQLNSDIDDIGATITRDEEAQAAYIGIDFLAPYLDKAVELLSDIIINPAFNEKEIDASKENIKISLKERQDNISSVAMDKFRSVFYKSTPYAFANLGSIESVNSIKVEDIKDWHKYAYNSQNIMISVAGNIEEKVLKKTLEAYFSNVESGEKFEQPSFTLIEPSKPIFRFTDKFHQSCIAVSFKAPSLNDKDYAAFVVAVNILGDGMNGRLAKEIRINSGFTYSIPMLIAALKQNNFTMIISAMDKRNINSALEKIDAILKEISETPVDLQEVNRVKAKIRSSYLLSNQTVQSKSFNNGWGETVFGNYHYNDNFIKDIEAVTVESVKSAAKKTFSGQSLTIIIDEK
ncbi:MAG: insulinase family protein [Elusimicrobiota bacterium]|jgi:predicted Zn-dependent peptidase|nr:insulinase family protein [Elusimicrobiota bacterium]